jgi:folate-binding protein YgfZ
MLRVTLDSFDLLRINGPDARKFLQGQVTCNVEQLSPSQSLQGAICNIKGRVVSDFRLLEYQDDCYLQLAAGMGSIVKGVLDKYIVFSKAKCQPVSEPVLRTGILGPTTHSELSRWLGDCPMADGGAVGRDNCLVIKIPGLQPRYEIWQFPVSDASLGALPNGLLADVTDTDMAAWELEDIRAGIVHITPAMSEQQLPEALNYDRTGVISFNKGCYTGQEIVARMYYRGSAKKRLYHGSCPVTGVKPQTVSCITATDREPRAGEILSAQPDEEGRWHLLAILPADVGAAGTQLYLNDDPALVVQLESLPYAIQ